MGFLFFIKARAQAAYVKLQLSHLTMTSAFAVTILADLKFLIITRREENSIAHNHLLHIITTATT